ncbi:MAG: MerR family transcriptional regulator [Hungatella hathewayi]|nr:MerR family transcriptional regulator [Hungatella hathewayi]
MNFDMLFSIGELAKICNITPKTLRFYDKLGLLKPAIVNPQNGYRFYTRWHITRVTTIKQLQDVGITLDDIQSFFKQDDETDIVESLSALLKLQEDSINRQSLELLQKLKKVRSLQLQCEKIKGKSVYDDETEITIRTIPKRKILYTSYQGTYTSVLFRKSYQELLQNIKVSGYNLDDLELSSPLSVYETPRNLKDGDYVNIKLGYEINIQQEVSLPTFYIEEALYACYVCKGPYEWIKSEPNQNLYKKLNEMGYQILIPQIEYYYINEAIAEDKNYLTEIQIPIK